MNQGTRPAAELVPSRTTGERLPWAASSSTWWKWEQNSTRVVAKAGPLPRASACGQGTPLAVAVAVAVAVAPAAGARASRAAAVAQGPKASQQRGSPRPRYPSRKGGPWYT